MHTTDEILLKAIEKRDEKAFSQFYERYSSTILCFVLSKVHNKEIAKEIVHEALKDSSSLTKNSFWMRVDSIPAKEVANELGVTTQTIHNKFSQSLATIRKYIKTYYPEIIKNRK